MINRANAPLSIKTTKNFSLKSGDMSLCTARISAQEMELRVNCPDPRCVSFLLGSAQGELAGAALFVFEGRAEFQEAIEHLGTFRAAGCQLRIGLLVHVLEAVKFVGDVQRSENRYFQ